MVARVYQGGDASLAASWLPAGAPVDGDTVDTNGLPITFTASATIGIDDGSAAISNPSQFPAGVEAAPITVAAGVELTLRGRIENSNGDLNMLPGSKISFTNSDAQVQDFGNFDNDTTSAPTLQVDNAVLEHVGSGSVVITINGGGAIILDNAIFAGIGDGANIITANIQSDPAQCFCARPAFFVRCKGRLDVQCFGDGTMGDIDITGLYNIDPVSGGDILFAGNGDTTLHATANKRIAQNIRAEGDVTLRHLQGYTSAKGLRLTGQPLTIAGSADVGDLSEWFVGNHNGSFMVALGNHNNSIFRDVANNPHSIAINRLRSTNPVLSRNLFLMDGIQNGTDTGDCFATNASSASTDFTTPGQTVELSDNLVIAGPHTGPSDGPVFLSLNGALAAGVHVMHKPQLKLLNNTGRFSNAGHAINADEASFAGASPPDTIIEHKRNIWSNHDAQAPMTVCVMLRGLTGASDDVITLGQSDENVFHLYPDGLGFRESAAGVNDQNTLSSVPQFVDASRNLETWAHFCVPGSVSEAEAIVNLVRAGFPGYGSTPAVDAAIYDVAKINGWIRQGHIDTEPAHAGRGITDTNTSIAVTGIDVAGGDVLQEAEIQTLLMQVAATATSMIVMDDNGNRETVTLGAKPGTTQESITLPAKGSLIFGDETKHHIVVNF